MKRVAIFILIMIIIVPIEQTMSLNTLHYTYSINPDDVTNNYVFSITFTDNMTVYSVNMSIDNNTFVLQEGLQKNNYFTYLPTKIVNTRVELNLVTSKGPITIVFIIKNNNEAIFNSDTIISVILFLILLILIAKYVLFFEVKNYP